MKKIDFVKMGFKSLWRRKLRTVLTMVGVMVGTFSIVIMVSLGIAMTEGYKEQLAQWGSLTQITVNKYNYIYDETTGSGTSTKKTFDDALVATIKNIEHVKAVTPTLNIQAKLKAGKYESYISITGIDVSAMKYFDYPEIEQGEMLSETNKNGILFGKNSFYFYNPRGSGGYGGYGMDNTSPVDLMNDNVKIAFDDLWNSEKIPKFSKLQVAGIFAESSSEANYSAYADIEQVKLWLKEQKKNSSSPQNQKIEYQNILVSVDDVDNVSAVQDQIKEMGYSTYSMADSLKEIQNTSNTLQLILGGIGAVSLLVSAIGIANTMVMSIYERTKEIGIMKVLGCLVTDIRKLFLLESGLIGFLGGAFGIGLSYGISFILNNYVPVIGELLSGTTSSKVSIIPVWLSLAAITFAMLIGIISGLYPARRATKIKALEAMRTES